MLDTDQPRGGSALFVKSLQPSATGMGAVCEFEGPRDFGVTQVPMQDMSCAESTPMPSNGPVVSRQSPARWRLRLRLLSSATALRHIYESERAVLVRVFSTPTTRPVLWKRRWLSKTM